jgi:hypothetical protein
MIEVHSVWHYVRLRKSDRERARDLRRCAQILAQYFFLQISKAAMRKSVNEEGLLYCKLQLFRWDPLPPSSESTQQVPLKLNMQKTLQKMLIEHQREVSNNRLLDLIIEKLKEEDG